MTTKANETKAETSSFRVDEGLYLVRHTRVHDAEAAKPVEVPTDHVFVCDCSGSMAADLPKIQAQIKKKTPKLMRDGDTLSIVWFSGRGECGVLLEREPLRSLTDLSMVNQMVDRWLRPVGLTGFKDPLEKLLELAEKVGAPGRAVSAFFLSDGCDNQWSRADILKVAEKLGPKITRSTFVEYGYYADRALLASMAEKAGGALIFAETFDTYEPQFDAAITKSMMGGRRVDVNLGGDAVGGFAWAMQGDDLLTFAAGTGTVSVPEDVTSVYSLATSARGTTGFSLGIQSKIGHQNLSHPSHLIEEELSMSAAYAAISLFAVRMKSDVVFPLLRAMGDVALIEEFAGCFGKQRYAAFTDHAKRLVYDAPARWASGWDPTRVPREDAFTVMHVLDLLEKDEKARVLLDSPHFAYSTIGRRRIDADEELEASEQEELRVLTEALGKEKDVAKVKEMTAKIAAFADKQKEALKFVRTPQPNGYEILKLTFNEDRPNVSLKMRREGTIDLSKRLSESAPDTIPSTFKTHIYRDYTLVKDGLVHLSKLPVRVSAATFGTLLTEGVIAGADRIGAIGANPDTADVVLDLRRIPILNRTMVKSVSAREFFTKKFALTKAQARQRVLNSYAEELPAKMVGGLVAAYGAEGAAWLKAQGIGDGYNPPHTKSVAATDFYLAKELKVSLAKYSTLPTVDKVREQMKAGKLTPTGALMAPIVEYVDVAKRTEEPANYEKWLRIEQKAATAACRKLIFEIAQTSFAIIVGQVWFSEFSSLEENSMSIEVGGLTIACKVEMVDVEVKV